jgi:UPF0755 protein
MLTTGCSAVQLLDKFMVAVDPEDTTNISVEISSGSTTDHIADVLLENDLILNKTAFKELAKSMEADTKFKAGTYVLSRSMPVEEIIDIISGGKVFIETTDFTIPEGFELQQIIERLESKELATRADLEDILLNGDFDYRFIEMIDRSHMLEGFLYPDTYTVEKGASASTIVNKMLSKFNLIFKETYYDRLEELDMSLEELMTLASIIEREAKLDDERAIISSVFHNRLDISMKLQSCATIQYALGERKDALTYADLEVESPYNTYIYAGLPPAPIASPGEKSIIAALYPETTDYLFFVTTENADGSHYFNETLEGHNKDKNR